MSYLVILHPCTNKPVHGIPVAQLGTVEASLSYAEHLHRSFNLPHIIGVYQIDYKNNRHKIVKIFRLSQEHINQQIKDLLYDYKEYIHC